MLGPLQCSATYLEMCRQHQAWTGGLLTCSCERAGQEIYLRRPDVYRLVGCTAAFEQVAELARAQEQPETAIGYITQACLAWLACYMLLVFLCAHCMYFATAPHKVQNACNVDDAMPIIYPCPTYNGKG